MFVKTSAAIATMVAILAPCAQGHGWMSNPMTRALCDGRSASGIFMPGGGNGAGPGMHDLGGVPGVCGDPFQSMTDTRTDFANKPCSIQETFTEGSEVTLTVELSNQHGGYFEFAICPMATGLTEECFAQNVLMTESGSTEYWAQPSAKSGTITVDNREVYNVKVQLPPGLTCTHCAVMWTWWTSHQCTYDCDPNVCGAYANFNNPMPTGGSGPPCATRTPGKGELPQMFRACGDIAIVPANGANPNPPMAPPPAPPAPAPAPTPTPAPVSDPTSAPGTPSPAPATTPPTATCGAVNQPACTNLTGREGECDVGLVRSAYGYCVTPPTTSAPTPTQPPTGAADPAACGGEGQPVCTDGQPMCGSGLVGMCVAHPSGMGSPAVIPSQGPSMAQMAKPPAEEDPFMRPDKEEEEENESMPTPTDPATNCGGLGYPPCATEPRCNAGLTPMNLGGASEICRKDYKRKLSAFWGQ